MSDPVVAAAQPAQASQPTAPAAPATQDNSEISHEDLAALAGESSTEGQAAPAAEAKQAVTEAEQKVKNAKTASAKEQAKKELEKARHVYSLKVDGEEMEWSGTDEDVKRELQLAKKARKEIQASSEMKKEIADFLSALKQDPRKVLTDPAFNVDMVELAKQIINEQIENELKSPEQLEKEKLQKELEDIRRERKEEQERRQKDEYDRQVKSYEVELEEKMGDALESSGLPKTAYVLKRAADVMLSGIENKKDISPKQALNIVKKEMQRDLKDMFSASPEDLLEDLLGSDNIKRINKRQLSKIKKPVVTASSIKDSGSAPKEEVKRASAADKKMTISEWLRRK